MYVETVQRLFQDFVTDEEAETLVRVWNRVLEGNGVPAARYEAAAALDEREQRPELARPAPGIASARIRLHELTSVCDYQLVEGVAWRAPTEVRSPAAP